MIAAEDAASLAVREGDRVELATAAGRLLVSVAIVAIRPGNAAMYHPEANALVAQRIDPRSTTPAFESISGRVRPVAA